MIQIVSLVVKPVVIDRNDPEWLRKLAGNFSTAIELSPAKERFPRSDEWPEIDPNRKYSLVRFKDEIISGFKAVDQRLTAEGFGPEKRTTFEELIRVVVPQCDELLALYEKGEGPAWVHASDERSLWQHSDGDLFLPFVDLQREYREFSAVHVEDDFGDGEGFLVACESSLAT